jgi:hypothetical protein
LEIDPPEPQPEQPQPQPPLFLKKNRRMTNPAATAMIKKTISLSMQALLENENQHHKGE